jgi:hypothetical protein
MADLVSCIYCGSKHSIDYATCFKCRQISGRDEAGRNLRLDIIIRDNFTCNDCGSHDGLQVDHIMPCVEFGQAKPWNLQVLCGQCNRLKGTNWYFGSKWDNKRVYLMHLYLTFGWSFLNSEEQEQLIIDTEDYTVFDRRARVLQYRDELPDPPDWAIAEADNQMPFQADQNCYQLVSE